jgi:hypothetical protein
MTALAIPSSLGPLHTFLIRQKPQMPHTTRQNNPYSGYASSTDIGGGLILLNSPPLSDEEGLDL